MPLDSESKKLLRKLGVKLKTLRKKRGWTLEETEEHGNVVWTHLQRIESGKKNISLSTALRLAKLYKISLSQLFEDL